MSGRGGSGPVPLASLPVQRPKMSLQQVSWAACACRGQMYTLLWDNFGIIMFGVTLFRICSKKIIVCMQIRVTDYNAILQCPPKICQISLAHSDLHDAKYYLQP